MSRAAERLGPGGAEFAGAPPAVSERGCHAGPALGSPFRTGRLTWADTCVLRSLPGAFEEALPGASEPVAPRRAALPTGVDTRLSPTDEAPGRSAGVDFTLTACPLSEVALAPRIVSGCGSVPWAGADERKVVGLEVALTVLGDREDDGPTAAGRAGSAVTSASSPQSSSISCVD